jgi:uncharacterized iron-regulated protein
MSSVMLHKGCSFFKSCTVLILLGWLTGCHTLQAQPPLEVGTIIRIAANEPVALESIHPELLEADIIFIGEEHYTPSHIEAAQKVLDILLAHRKQVGTPVLAMEMFSWDGQPALDRYITDPQMPLAEFLENSKWKQAWGGDFQDYQPLVTYAQNHGLPLLGLNPPRQMVRQVAQEGLEKALKIPELAEWAEGELVIEDREYENLIFEQITACHPDLPDQAYRRIFEASIVRDEGMARVIRNYLDSRQPSEGPLVSYTGGGHIQYGIPVPKRVKRTHPDIKTVTIYLVAWDPSKEPEVVSEIQEGIADYLWLTELGPKGIQPRCG